MRASFSVLNPFLEFSCFLPRDFQLEESVYSRVTNSLILTYLCHCEEKKKKKRILSSQLVSPFSLKLYLLEPYWFSYHLNEELNAFNIWPQNPLQKSFSCLHSFPTTVIPLFGLTALHNQLGKSKRISSPGWNSVDSRWWESTPGQLPRNHAKSLKEGSKEEKVQHPIDF